MLYTQILIAEIEKYDMRYLVILNCNLSGPCRSDIDCEAADICEEGQCRHPCGVSGACGLRALCSVQGCRIKVPGKI